MEQDEVYHSAMDAAGSKIKNGNAGLDNNGRPLADAARRQRKAIQSEQVCTDAVQVGNHVQDDTLRFGRSVPSRVAWNPRVSLGVSHVHGFL